MQKLHRKESSCQRASFQDPGCSISERLRQRLFRTRIAEEPEQLVITERDSCGKSVVSSVYVHCCILDVTLNGQALSGFNYNFTTKVLKVTGLQNATSSGAWANDWVLQW